MRRKAIPPPTPMAQRSIKPIKAFVSPIGIQPMAVFIPSSSPVVLQVGSFSSCVKGLTEQQTRPAASQVFTFLNWTSPDSQLVLQTPGQATGVTSDLGTQQNSDPLGPAVQPVAVTGCSFELQEVLQVPPWELQLWACASAKWGKNRSTNKNRAETKKTFFISIWV